MDRIGRICDRVRVAAGHLERIHDQTIALR
jgi:hypothetical protein